MDWIIVRFKDDSPADGVGGAAVQEVQLVVNGEARPDLVPRIISHQADPSLQVGSTSALTGKFQALRYDYFSAGSAATPYVNEYYYRGPRNSALCRLLPADRPRGWHRCEQRRKPSRSSFHLRG